VQIKYVKSPLLQHDHVCQSCGVTSATTYVHPCAPVFVVPLGGDSGHKYPGQDHPICARCYEVWTQKYNVQRPFENDPDIEKVVRGWLKDIGMSVDEVEAQLKLIPRALLTSIPELSLKCLMAGIFLKVPGFSLCSRPGLGKTQAIAAFVREGLLQNAVNSFPFRPLPKELTTITWMNVPLTVSRWRLWGISPQVAEDIHRAQNAKLLILDDLGREVDKAGVGKDVATGHIDAIITHRDREGRPTIWTSNLDEDELLERYETPLYRRLTRLNPMKWVK